MPDAHPWFARLYDPLLAPIEALGLRRQRRAIVEDTCGVVLEVGAGTGLNLQHYGAASSVIATEPEMAMLCQARRRAAFAKVPVRLVCADVQSLPFADATFDSAIATCVFCTVPGPLAGFRELHRVLKPGAELRLLEHVRSHGKRAARLQDLAAPGWACLAGGCRLNRPTLETVQSAGFRVTHLERRFGDVVIVATLVTV